MKNKDKAIVYDEIRDYLFKKGWKVDDVSHTLTIDGAYRESFIHPDFSDGSHSLMSALEISFNPKVKTTFDAQTFLAKIDRCLFEEKYDSVTINFKDYQDLFLKNSDKISKRYEPETSKDMLINGFMGYLHGPNGEPPKPIKLSRLVESTKVRGSREI